MKTMRIFVLGIMALALALASGSAEAKFILKVEDPALPGGVREVVDNGDGDLNFANGAITTAIDEAGISTVINAISRIDRTIPRIVLDLEGYQTPSDSVTFSVTDTDFTVAENTPARALVWGVQDAGNSASFRFAGDTDNGEFVEGFTLSTYNETEPEYEFGQEGVLEPAVGSLTLSGVVEKGTNFEEVIETTFTMILQVGQSTARNCPPFISNETISRLGTIGDGCVIQDSTIEDGDVSVKEVTGFSMTRSVVINGDVDIEDVGGTVTVQRNRVSNGDIEITGTTAPNVRGNIVNGSIELRKNHSPSVIRNVFSNNNMEVSDNTGSTVVEQNTGLESSNLKVDNNATVAVTNNTTGRDIECEDNDDLSASRNSAGRKLECPKDDGLF